VKEPRRSTRPQGRMPGHRAIARQLLDPCTDDQHRTGTPGRSQ
jgi:hypothetical protein